MKRHSGFAFTGTQVEAEGAQMGDFLPVRIGSEKGFIHISYLKKELARCRDAGNGIMAYMLSGNEASQTEYEVFMQAQEAKPAVKWHVFEKTAIQAAFME